MKIKITKQYMTEELSTLIIFKEIYDNGVEGNGFFLKIEDRDMGDFVNKLKEI